VPIATLKNQSWILKVPGAQLYYETEGSGPVLLMIPGGPGDAGGFADLARFLTDRYTVVRYDPRGNSRSVLESPPEDQQMEVHGDDAAQLLGALSDQPAYVLGSSGGAQIGLNLTARYPERVRALVAESVKKSGVGDQCRLRDVCSATVRRLWNSRRLTPDFLTLSKQPRAKEQVSRLTPFAARRLTLAQPLRDARACLARSLGTLLARGLKGVRDRRANSGCSTLLVASPTTASARWQWPMLCSVSVISPPA
jgi:pimeloyl-ACP methyl ester carboxylesterase